MVLLLALHLDNVFSSINVFAFCLLLIITLAILLLTPVRQIAKHRVNARRIVVFDHVNATVKETLAVCFYWIWDRYLPLGITAEVDIKPQSRKNLPLPPSLSKARTGGLAFWKEASDVIVSSCRIKGSQPAVLIRVICWQKVLRWNKAHQMHSGSSWTGLGVKMDS